MVDTADPPRRASPTSTGGAGTSFEQHVGAYWLAQLLVRSIPPILIDTLVTEVSFQTERLGWQTDDFLVTGTRAGAEPRKLVGQVKRTFTVSAGDEECKKAIGDFWRDFKSPDRFSAEDDRLVLVTLRGTNVLLEHFVGLLDCARASRDCADFERRLATEGFLSNKAVQYCRELQEIIGEVEASTASAADIWPLLRVLHVVSLDLFTSTRQTEAQIKSLLAYTVTEGDPVGGAAASWNELIAGASTAMAAALTLRHQDLPAALRERHSSISGNEQRVLHALGDHTATTLRGIRSAIGPNLHLKRAALVQKVIADLERAQVVLVTGPAGSGKSAISKDVFSELSRDHFAFAFRVEEFAEPHLDRALAASGIPSNAITFKAILAAQDRKLILVESVERLLERTTRDAFSDLTALAVDDPGLRIILTCRDYSVEQVRTSFLHSAAIKHAVVRVPPLDDAEVWEVEEALPALAIPLRNPVLRNTLRNPFFLDKAFQISWSAERPIPESERELRALFWREIVRADHRITGGMGRRREEALREIAVRRARALSAHVPANDIDPAVIESLRNDSLITSPGGNWLVVATAHDVLEDWAILQWLEEQHLTEVPFKAISAAIGAQPALRRSYRKWVAELVARDTLAADHLFLAAISETNISMQFRDDTLVSLLKAPTSADFLARHEALLLANDREVLKRVIQLLRVSCVKAPDWLAGVLGVGSVLNVPDGVAWPAVLRLTHRNLDAFTWQDRGLLLGLVEDAVRNVSRWEPDLEGAEFVAGIAHWLLDGLRGYGGGEVRKRVLKVIAKVPNADTGRFEAVLRGRAGASERRDPAADDLREMIFLGIDGMAVARDLPDLVVSVGSEYLLASDDDIRRDRYMGSGLDIELHFGIRRSLHLHSYPASAIRGPWMSLLQHHPRTALDFFIRVFSHSVDWYAHPRLRRPLEPAWEVELTFADGTTRKQWVNPRLWALYRGMSVGPYILQSMLMAFETWLLELAEQHPARLDGTLIEILRRTDSAALAAVVASVATAYPHQSGETLLVLLGVREYIEIDRSRMANERQASSLTGMFPTMNADHRVYEVERKKSNAIPHRGRDLEAAIATLQLGPLSARVHAILDQHLAGLPPRDEQQEGDRVWRLAIHRMDLRQYTVSEAAGPEVAGTAPGDPPRQLVRLEARVPDADLQEMVEESEVRFAAMNARLGVLLWGLKAFQRETEKYDPSLWAEKLSEAGAMDRDTDHQDGSRHAPGFVAAVCIRDRWDEMSTHQRDWCVDVACSEVLRRADPGDDLERMERNSMAADRPCSFVLSLLLGKSLAQPQVQRIREAFAAAIAHPIDEVRSYAAWSIDEEFWTTNRSVALRCVNAIATEAELIEAARESEENRPYDERRQIADIMAEAASSVREWFWDDAAIAEDAHSTVDVSGGFGAYALPRMLVILGRIPLDSLAIAAFARASETLVAWWDTRYDHDHERERNFHMEADVSERLQHFLIRTSPAAAQHVLTPVLGAIDRHSREIQSIVQGLTVIQDGYPNTPQYWFLWGLFADAVRRAPWLPQLVGEHPNGSELLSALFLTAYWKEDVRHWRFLDGYADRVHSLFEALPVVAIVLDDYIRFLYHIGERSLPAAFARVSESLRRGNAQAMLTMTNTVFMLEVLLQRHVYGRPLELKSDARIREGVLFILDCLVEAGSSAAFRMRDDFVTPAAQ
jgi:hypothetical protein